MLVAQSKVMSKSGALVKVPVGLHGRLVVPAEIRRTIREVVLQRVRQRFAHIPKEVRLSDELIAERRSEAGGEDRG
jgi:bifunctional DNA-binding transcriptional regulator/antitoxin component of YhaV-PrlF toxin-antitoxin module